jgi:hypothetical protein
MVAGGDAGRPEERKVADDDRRVEPRTVLVGRGSAATPEKIEEIRRRALEMEKLDRKKPAREFAAVIADLAEETQDEDLSEKEKRQRALPKRGPRPGLLHPAQRDAYGREDDGEDPVIIKG